jgi:hypothetical protein
MPIFNLGTAAVQSSYVEDSTSAMVPFDSLACSSSCNSGLRRTLYSETNASRLGTSSPSNLSVVLYCANSFEHSGVYLDHRHDDSNVSHMDAPNAADVMIRRGPTLHFEWYLAHKHALDDPD